MRMYRQGDVLIREVLNPSTTGEGEVWGKNLPNLKLSELPKDNGKVILAYGEVTGHTHAFAKEAKVGLYHEEGTGNVLSREILNTRAVSIQELTRDPTLRRFLRVDEEKGATLLHEEHAPISIPKGLYEIIIQREYAPDKIRQVED